MHANHFRPALLVAVLLATPHLCLAAPSRAFSGRVVSVHDGDAITVLDTANRQHKVRVEAIDAPALHQAIGQRSTPALGEKVTRKTVRVTYREFDR